MKNLITTFSVMVGLLSFSVLANNSNAEGLYSEIAYETFSESNDDLGDIDLSYSTILLGYQFSRNTSVEAYYGQGGSPEEVRLMGVFVDVSFGTIYGVTLKTEFDLSKNINAYAKLKYADMEMEAEAMGFSIDESDSDLGLSVGFEFGADDGLYATSSFTLWGMENETTQTGFKIGIGYNF